MMDSQPDSEKIKALRGTLSNFLKHVNSSGYTFFEPDKSLVDFLDKEEFATLAAENLIKTIWAVLHAEAIAKANSKRN